MSPFNAWVMAKALETLELRVERQTANAARIAAWLEARPDVRQVSYPGLPRHPPYALARRPLSGFGRLEIGSASSRERVCQDVSISVVVAFITKTTTTYISI